MTYNAKEWWSKHLEENFSLSGVGFTGFGKEYNKWLYKMRKKVLERAVSKHKIDVANMRILDIGCGSGFYEDIFVQKGAKYLTGIDITAISIKELSVKYPTFNFYEADIASPTLIQNFGFKEKSFDIITAFDILFHIDVSNGLLQKFSLRFWWCIIVAMVERTTHLLGPTFFILDSLLTRVLTESPSTEMIICTRVKSESDKR